MTPRRASSAAYWPLLLLALALAFTLLFAPPAAAADCYSEIGCTTCSFRWSPAVGDFIVWCDLLSDANGGCACFTWFEGGTMICQNFGSCVYTGWQGGGPPPV